MIDYIVKYYNIKKINSILDCYIYYDESKIDNESFCESESIAILKYKIKKIR